MTTAHQSLHRQRGSGPLARWGLVLAPLAAVLVYGLLQGAAGLSDAGRVVAAVAVLMGGWWLSEALPIAATALLPIALFPLLTGGELSIREVTAPYAHEMIFLFMGGFLIALAMQQWGLHRRIALHIILRVGDQPRSVVLGFMLATALLSMWISNTATVVMMLPIALSVIDLVRQRYRESEIPQSDDASSGEVSRDDSSAAEDLDPSLAVGNFNFAVALLLGVAYSASIGGTATLIGTPPNLMMAAFMSDNYAREITFGAWIPFGLPFALVLLPITWLVLTRWVFPIGVREIPGGRDLIRTELDKCGPLTRPERGVLIVFCTTAMLWMLRSPLGKISVAGFEPFAGLTDQGIAILAAMVLFAWPVELRRAEFLLSWEQAVRLPWGILLLFGGGLSLAAAVRGAGVDVFVGQQLRALGGLPEIVLILIVTACVILLTEMTSNAATTATFLPIVAASAEGMGLDPLKLVIPATLAASCAFMMPVATPPNAIVFGSGELSIPQMFRAGIWMNLIAMTLIVILVLLLGGPLLGIA